MSLIRTLSIALIWASASQWSVAGPGAHGPNGEHLDAPHQAAGTATASPKLEAQTELFELVATLAGGELSILIDRFETNEPLLNAKVEVESGDLKTQAHFHADLGDYAVDDEAMLKRLNQPGSHPLVITVLAGKESDLLDGTLNVTTTSVDGAAEQHHVHDQGWGAKAKWLAVGVSALALLAAFLLGRLSSSDVASETLRGNRS
jgi:hypothetical protein